MTLILALDCADGLILASDGQATIETSGLPTKGPEQKLYCTWDNIAWGGSGIVGIIQRVELDLRATFPSNAFVGQKRFYARQQLSAKVAGVVRPLFQDRILTLPGMRVPLTSFLFCGYLADGPFILEIAPNLVDQDHISRGYAAIGSAEVFPYFALTSLGHFNVRDLTLEGAKLIAYRVMDDAIKVVAEGIGPPIQLVEVRKPEAEGQAARVRHLSSGELRIIGDKVEEWKVLEGDTLRLYLGLAPGASGPEEQHQEERPSET